MSKYTTEVRFICETAAGLDSSKEYSSVNDIITEAIPKVFNFDFPIFDEAYRNVLARKILKHFYTREIGEETVGLWKLRLDTKLNEIMPYYNKMYMSELIEFNPLYTTDLTRTKENKIDSGSSGTINSTNESETTNEFENQRSGEIGSETINASSNTTTGTFANENESTFSNENDGSGSGTNTNENVDKFSETPQGALTNVENGTYLTNARMVNDSATNSSTTHNESSGTNSVNANGTTSENASGNSTSNVSGTNSESGSGNSTSNTSGSGRVVSDNTSLTTENYLEHVVGYESRSASKMLLEYRQTFINIDMMVINELEPLFMQLW